MLDSAEKIIVASKVEIIENSGNWTAFDAKELKKYLQVFASVLDELNLFNISCYAIRNAKAFLYKY